MKKVIILAAALFSLMLLSQCNKSSSCKCDEYDATDNYYYGSRVVDPASWGAANCSDLELKLRAQALQSGYDERFNCTKQ